MKKFSWVSALSLCGLVYAGGCDAVEPEDQWIEDDVTEVSASLRMSEVQGRVMNGFRVQGFKIQGFKIQGITIQGFNIQGLSIQGISIQGITIQGITVQGSTLSGFKVTEVGGQEVLEPISGVEMAGAELVVVDDETETEFTLRIDDVYPDPSNPDGDVLFYQVSYKDPETAEWMPTCADAEDNESIAMGGTWDEDSGDRIDVEGVFSFSCRNGVVAKCTEWGYRPWAEQEGQDLAPFHQACTRMARADYCGDGTPHTLNGVTIDIEDQLDTSLQTFESNWFFEAEWNEDGAVCLNAWNSRIWLMDDIQLPSCLQEIAHKPKCGWHPSAETLLVNRFSFLYNWWKLH